MTQDAIRVILVSIIVLVAGCDNRRAESTSSGPQAESKPEATHAMPLHPSDTVRQRLKTDAATVRSVPETVTAPGEVALDLKQVAMITSRIQGQIEQIHVQLGDRVKKGQPLVAVGSLQLDQLIEEYLVAKAQADVAENTL